MTDSHRPFDKQDNDGLEKAGSVNHERGGSSKKETTGSKGLRIGSSYRDVASRYRTTADWSGEAAIFIKKLKEGFINDNSEFKIDVVRVGSCEIFYHDNVAVVLVPGSDNLSVTDALNNLIVDEAQKEIKRSSKVKDMQIVNICVIDKRNYDRLDQVANFIVNVIKMVCEPNERLTARDFVSKDEKSNLQIRINVECDMNVVNRFFEDNSPTTGTPSHLGFVVQYQEYDKRTRTVEYSSDLIGCKGYIDFAIDQQGYGMDVGSSYYPEVHVSEVVSTVPDPSLIGLIYGLAPKKFLTEVRWARVFADDATCKFGDVLNFAPNPDTNQLMRRDKTITSTDILRFFQEVIKDRDINERSRSLTGKYVPLYFDIISGAMNLPGLNALARSESPDHNELINDISKFFNTDRLAKVNENRKPSDQLPTFASTTRRMQQDDYESVIGSVVVPGLGATDTRAVTYLQALRSGITPEVAQPLREKSRDERAHISKIMNFDKSVRPTHLMRSCLLDPRVAIHLISLINVTLDVVSSDNAHQFYNDGSNSAGAVFNTNEMYRSTNVYNNNNVGRNSRNFC